MFQTTMRIVCFCVAVDISWPARAQEIPSLPELAHRLVQRSETLDDIAVSYHRTEEFLIPVTGITPADLQPLMNGRYRTVMHRRKRRFERFPDQQQNRQYPSSVVIFDGQTTADAQVKKTVNGIGGVSVFLHRGKTNLSGIDCQYCLCALQKPLSDDSSALGFEKILYPWNLLYSEVPGKQHFVEIEPKLSDLEDSRCCVIRFHGGIESYWLDVDRDFALVRRERFEMLGDRRSLDVRSTARNFRQHGEHWVPYEYVREHGVPPHAKEQVGEVYYRVKLNVEDIRFGGVTDDEFKVELADGASIVDVESGRMVENPTGNLAQIADLVAQVKWSWYRWLIIGIAVTLGGAFAVFYYRRSRKQAKS